MVFNYRILCLLGLALSGCVRDTSLDAGLERKVVVEFVLTEAGVQNLYLSLARGPGELAAPAIQEAEIKLINVSNRFEPEHQFVKVADNQWSLDYSGIPGDEYRLEVRVDGYGLVWAEQGMPEKVELGRAAIGHVSILPNYVGYGNFYYIDNLPDFLMIRGLTWDQELGEYVPVEKLCTDYPGVEEINTTEQVYDGYPKWRTGIGWHWSEIGWEGADFVYHDSPVDGDDGVWTYIFPNLIGKKLHNDFLFITRVDDNHAGLDALYTFSRGYDYSTKQEDLSAKGFCISGSFLFGQELLQIEMPDDYLVVSSLSPDYGQFMRDAWQLKKVHEGGDLSSIYLRDNIHSNINGGLGLFGAVASSTTTFYGHYHEK